MTEIENVTITAQNAEQHTNLQAVSGDLTIEKGVVFEANQLESVGKNVFVKSHAALKTTKLHAVGGFISVQVCGKCNSGAHAILLKQNND